MRTSVAGEGPPEFALWTLLFAALIGHLGVALARLPLGYGALAALLAVPALAFANVWLVRSMLGPWAGAFGLPVFYPWLGGGFVGAFVGMHRQRGAAANRGG